jgi:FkbM family methyltransferase
MKFVKETDTVLEIGGNIGRNSCVIASILNDDTRLVVLESCQKYADQLKENRDENYFNFQIEASALSKVPLIQKEWNTYVGENVPDGYTKVNTITFDKLKEKYSLDFNVLVLDCEGAIYQILKDEETLLDNIETIIIENDFLEIDKKEFVHNFFKEKGFKLIWNQKGGWGPCYSCFFQVYQK